MIGEGDFITGWCLDALAVFHDIAIKAAFAIVPIIWELTFTSGNAGFRITIAGTGAAIHVIAFGNSIAVLIGCFTGIKDAVKFYSGIVRQTVITGGTGIALIAQTDGLIAIIVGVTTADTMNTWIVFTWIRIAFGGVYTIWEAVSIAGGEALGTFIAMGSGKTFVAFAIGVSTFCCTLSMSAIQFGTPVGDTFGSF